MFKKTMLPLAALSALLLTAAPAIACGTDKNCGGVCSTSATKAEDKAVVGEVVTSVYKVTGMKCQNCANGVTNKLREVAGVANVVVDLKAATATVKHAKGQAGVDTLNAALKGHFKLAADRAADDTIAPAKPAEHGPKGAAGKTGG